MEKLNLSFYDRWCRSQVFGVQKYEAHEGKGELFRQTSSERQS